MTAFHTKDKNVVSVKGGCIDGLDWKTAIHIWANSAMVPIPEGSETHSEGSSYTDYGTSQEELDQPCDGITGSGEGFAQAQKLEEKRLASSLTDPMLHG